MVSSAGRLFQRKGWSGRRVRVDDAIWFQVLKKDNQISAQDFVILSRMQIYMQINYRPTLSAKRGYFD